MAKRKVKREAVAAPQSLPEAHGFMQRLGELAREIDGHEIIMNNRIERIKTEALEKVASLEEELNACAEGLASYAEAHRDELTGGGSRKTVPFLSGVVMWRLPPTSVKISSVDKVLAELKRRGLTRFVRMKPEPDKEAMLRDQKAAEKVPGVSFSQVEVLVMRPAETRVEVESRKGKLKRVVPNDKKKK